MTFERKIMRKIYGPTRTEGGYWRIKTNQETNDILKGQNIIGFIKKLCIYIYIYIYSLHSMHAFLSRAK